MTIGVRLPEPLASRLIFDLEAAGEDVRTLPPDVLWDDVALDGIAALVVLADPEVLTPAVLSACDRAGVRIVPYVHDARSIRHAAALGLPAVDEPSARAVSGAVELAPSPARQRTPAGIITVWGPHGAPGRTSLAVALAAELSRGSRDVCLIDADSHAPAVAQMLGMSDDVAGLAGACRQVGRHRLDEAEFFRIRTPIAAGAPGLTSLTGINRPSRWPELRGDLVGAVLGAVRGWTDHVVVDTAASLEQDEQLVSDIAGDGPRRNAATLAALGSADHVVAVASAEPVGLARFVRAFEDVRTAAAGATVTVVANRVRGSIVGVDARTQIRAVLNQLAGIDHVRFLPDDRPAHDRAALRATTVADVAPRSPYVAAVRRLAADLVG